MYQIWNFPIDSDGEPFGLSMSKIQKMPILIMLACHTHSSQTQEASSDLLTRLSSPFLS